MDWLNENLNMGLSDKPKILNFKFLLINKVPKPEIADTTARILNNREITPPYR